MTTRTEATDHNKSENRDKSVVVKLTTNRSDWSGEEVTVWVNTKTWTWELNGYSWSLIERFEKDLNGKSAWDFTVYELWGNEWNERLTATGVFANEKEQPTKIQIVERFVKYVCNCV